MLTGRTIDPRAREYFNFRTATQRRRKEYEWEEWLIRVLKRLGWNFREDLIEGEVTREYLLERNWLIQLEKFYRRIHKNPSFRFTREEKNKLLKKFLIGVKIEKSITLTNDLRTLEFPLIDREDIKNNYFELVQQVEEYHRGRFTHIYDLVLLINGIPLVCIELKKATISNVEAFCQLQRYEADRLKCEPLSIFNNFQIFIATNFQRAIWFWKRDIPRLRMDWCDGCIFPQLSDIYLHFKTWRIVQQIFEKDTRLARKARDAEILIFWNIWWWEIARAYFKIS